MVSHFQGYIDPEKVGSADSAQPSASGSGVSLPLDASVLSHNLGVPLVVVGTKVSERGGIDCESERSATCSVGEAAVVLLSLEPQGH